MRRGEKLHIIIVLSVAAAAALTSGCVRRSLEYKPSQFPDGEGLVEVTMVWPEGVQPDSARLYFYHVDGSVLRVHEGLTEYFYSGTMPEGDYRLILHNEDMVNTGVKSTETYGGAYLHALDVSGDEPGVGSVLSEPHNVYGCGAHGEGETFHVTAGDTVRLRVGPECMTKHLHLLISISGLEVSSFTGTLHGVSPAVTLSSRERTEISCVQPFEASYYEETKASREPLRMLASMEMLDLLAAPDSPDGTHSLEVCMTAAGGLTVRDTLDLTRVLAQTAADNGGAVPHITSLELKFTYVETAGIDFSVKTTDWIPGDPWEGELK